MQESIYIKRAIVVAIVNAIKVAIVVAIVSQQDVGKGH